MVGLARLAILALARHSEGSALPGATARRQLFATLKRYLGPGAHCGHLRQGKIAAGFERFLAWRASR